MNFSKPLQEPDKGAKTHHQQYRRRQPTNYEELFNQRHSSRRSVIEYTFGVWKKWKVLKHMSSFSFNKQVKIVIATMALHNYVRRHSRIDKHFVTLESDQVIMQMVRMMQNRKDLQLLKVEEHDK